MRILGIDPGYAIMGWAVLDMKGNHFTAVDYDSIMTDAGMPMPERLQALYAGLVSVIEQYHPEEASIEELFYNSNAKTVIHVGEARGVAINLPEVPKPDDTADAVAAAICHGHSAGNRLKVETRML